MQKQLQGVTDDQKKMDMLDLVPQRKKNIVCILQTLPTKSIINNIKSIRRQPTCGGTEGEARGTASD